MPPSFSDLTDDILTEIFLNLPVKSIGLSRCVCKPWLALLTNPTFIKSHLDRSKLKPPHLLTLTPNNFNPSQIFQTLDTNHVDEFVDITTVHLPPWIPFTVIGSCNGFVCLWDDQQFLCLMNPSTREFIEVPFNPSLADTNLAFDLGFGFVPETEEYKIVTIASTRYQTKFQVMVYTVGKDSSWRCIEKSSLSPFRIIGTSGAYIDGVLHWIARRNGTQSRTRSVLCFDLRNETFGDMPWLEIEDDSIVSDTNIILKACNGALVVSGFLSNITFGGDGRGGALMWLRKEDGVQQSWVTLLLGSPPRLDCLGPFLFMENGEVLLQTELRNLLLYDPQTETARVPIIRGARSSFLACTCYVEALTSIKSVMAGNRVEGRNQAMQR